MDYSYDNRQTPYPDNGQVVAAGESCWHCWGSFHPSRRTPANAAGFLGQQHGSLPIAQCMVQPNADSQIVAAALGTIFTYGVDGVCHQLANQVLYATGGQVSPMTVRGARGYVASTFIYGTYGLQQTAWANRIASCGGGSPQTVSMRGAAMIADGSDEFEQRARTVLGSQDPGTLAKLLALRADVHRFAAQRWPGTGQPNADALNARNQVLLDEAAKLLGPDRFKEIFGFPAGETIQLVRPDIGGESDQGPLLKLR